MPVMKAATLFLLKKLKQNNSNCLIRLLFLFGIILFLCPGLSAQEFGKGLLLDSKLYEKAPRSARLMRGDLFDLPASVSLKDFTPTPQSQGSYSTCAGWACAFYGRTILEAIKYNLAKDDIDKNTFSPSFVYNLIRMNDQCSNGVSLFDALEVLKNSGASKMSVFGYDCQRTVSKSDIQAASEFKIQDYRVVAERSDKLKFMKVKKSLSEHKPVIIAFNCPASFYNARDVWNPLPEDYSGSNGGHAITVIGYNDSTYGGAFEIINSWGKNWGNGGYTWIRYKDFEFFTVFAFELIDSFQTENNTLSGTLKFIESTGDKMFSTRSGDLFQMDEPYMSGTKFELLLSNDQPAYVYALSSDLENNVDTIFPQNSIISALLPYKKNNVAIPDENSYMMLDDVKGKSYFCFLYSKEPLDFKKVLRQIKEGEGTFSEKVHRSLGDKLITEDVKYSDGTEIHFHAPTSDKNVVAVIVEFTHE
jgi:hypothetical protein